MENILNIVNFIRGAEPRDRNMDLVKPVREQIRLMKELNLPGTFLVQYDAMLREDIMELLLPLDPEQFEIGIWLEMNQPHVEAAGLKWRGREGFEWDWHANVGFSVGYTPKEREMLVDAIFGKFEECFHRTARSVGSWMIDAHTLAYLAERYGVVASCNCKDQWGTDGYTIWGGYWNQGYYPSRNNALCPAQTEEGQIRLPVFRMLGSDPVTQYDLGLKVDDSASPCQLVASLEPVYGNGGGKAEWVDWFMRQNFSGNSLAFAYAQAGQENSFGWEAMKVGLEYQFPLFAEWRKEKKLRVERLQDTGKWYRESFKLTPPTAVCAVEPDMERGAQSVWYDCKRYRVNLYRDTRGLRLRDITLFDESTEEKYLLETCKTEYLVYENLPIMDGNRMSGKGILAGGWIADENGQPIATSAVRAEESDGGIRVIFDRGSIAMTENGITITGVPAIRLEWLPEKATYNGTEGDRLLFTHNGTNYAMRVINGRIETDNGLMIFSEGEELRLVPEKG